PAAQATRFLVPFCRSDKKGPAQEGGTKRFNSDNMSPAARAVEPLPEAPRKTPHSEEQVF
ncbi:hypothetical protein PO002_40255, partial [Cupriavidus necator]|uniref:hypothetical protein n=1 Tax=Cupriavidus necator TaxID=106590 RepID=UPI0039C0D61D